MVFGTSQRGLLRRFSAMPSHCHHNRILNCRCVYLGNSNYPSFCDMSIEVGKAAPPFTLVDTDGNDVSLESFRGRNVVVYFYPRDDTPGCTKEACGFRDLWDEIQDTNTVVLGISPDNEKAHRKFVDKYELPFTLLCDPDHSVMKNYGAYGEKTLYGKKMLGVIRSTVIVGPDGSVLKHWKRVSRAADHPEKVLEFIQAAEKA